jgi:hypothetical protein
MTRRRRTVVALLLAAFVGMGAPVPVAQAALGDSAWNVCFGSRGSILVSVASGARVRLYCGQSVGNAILVTSAYNFRVAQNYSNRCYRAGTEVVINDVRDNKADAYTVYSC